MKGCRLRDLGTQNKSQVKVKELHWDLHCKLSPAQMHFFMKSTTTPTFSSSLTSFLGFFVVLYSHFFVPFSYLSTCKKRNLSELLGDNWGLWCRKNLTRREKELRGFLWGYFCFFFISFRLYSKGTKLAKGYIIVPT